MQSKRKLTIAINIIIALIVGALVATIIVLCLIPRSNKQQSDININTSYTTNLAKGHASGRLKVGTGA